MRAWRDPRSMDEMATSVRVWEWFASFSSAMAQQIAVMVADGKNRLLQGRTAVNATSWELDAVNGKLALGGVSTNPFACLECNSPGQALLLPRVTLAQASGIPFPAAGMVVFMPDMRCGAEGPGTGSGGLAFYKTKGPAGAGWYDQTGAALAST